MKNKNIYKFLLVLTLVLSACEVLPTNNSETDSIQDAVATVVSATQTASVGSIEAPTETVEVTATVVETPILCSPTHPGTNQTSPIVGIALSRAASPEQLFLYDLEGTSIGSITLPGIQSRSSSKFHLVSNTTAIYSTHINYNYLLKVSQNNIATDLTSTNSLITMVGIKGSDYIVYSSDADSGTNELLTELFSGDYQSIGNQSPILSKSDSNYYAINPLSIQTDNGQPVGIWYTELMYGIGGIIFAPHRGLFYLDLNSSNVTTFVERDYIITGLSPDNSWVGYTFKPVDNNSVEPQNSITLKNLITCQEIILPFNSTTNLGGGILKFSPNNQYIAWIEAFGPDTMQSVRRIRVAQIDGTILIDALPNSLAGLAGGEVPSSVHTIGWIDDHILAVQLEITGFNDPLTVIWAPDPNNPIEPALGANQSVLIGSGIYMGFLYP